MRRRRCSCNRLPAQPQPAGAPRRRWVSGLCAPSGCLFFMRANQCQPKQLLHCTTVHQLCLPAGAGKRAASCKSSSEQHGILRSCCHTCTGRHWAGEWQTSSKCPAEMGGAITSCACAGAGFYMGSRRGDDRHLSEWLSCSAGGNRDRRREGLVVNIAAHASIPQKTALSSACSSLHPCRM